MEGHPPDPDHQQNANKQSQTAALATLLDAAGLEPADLLTALQTLAEAKKAFIRTRNWSMRTRTLLSTEEAIQKIRSIISGSMTKRARNHTLNL